MSVSYNKLWKLLIDHKMNRGELRVAAQMSPNTLAKLGKDEDVSLDVLKRICGVLKCDIGDIMEIIPKSDFYNYENKYQPGATIEVCPADITPEQEEIMQKAAMEVFRILGLSVYSRADFILTEDNKAYFLEINTLPGMTPTSLLPQEAAAAGIDYSTLCEKVLELSLEARKQGM